MATSQTKDELIAVSPEKLHVGIALRFTLRDERGQVLLAKGLRIENHHALEALQKRRAVYVNYEESDEAVKVLMSGLNEATRRDAAIKDMDGCACLKALRKLNRTAALPAIMVTPDSSLFNSSSLRTCVQKTMIIPGFRGSRKSRNDDKSGPRGE